MFRNASLGAAVIVALAAGSVFANKGGDWFKEMDSNKDGKVSSIEHSSAASAKFDKADTSKDGILTEGELAGFMTETKGKSAGKARRGHLFPAKTRWTARGCA